MNAKIKKRIDQLKELGIDVSNLKRATDLITLMDYCILRFSDRALRDYQIAEKLKITEDTLIRLKSTDMMQLAIQIVLADHVEDRVKQDVRAQIFASLQKNIPVAIENISNIAAGRAKIIKKKNEDTGEMEDIEIWPAYRDQVAALQVLTTNPMVGAWTAINFMGEKSNDETRMHLEMRDRLLQGHAISLDDHIIEMEPSSITVKNA